jgi:HlyD family secretion protein
MNIRDTSAQDRSIAQPGSARRKRLMIAVAATLALATAGGGVLWARQGGSRSVDAQRLRVADVVRGDLVRDLAAEGRVIAANSPTLYAIAAGTVTLKVVAGDTVKRDQVLAEIDSPELRSRLAQEQATLASLQADAERALLDAELTRAGARRSLAQAQVDQTAAQRDLERNRRAFAGGAVAQIDVARAEDALKKAELALASAQREQALEDRGAGLDARNKRAQAERQRAVVGELQRQVDALQLRAPFDGQVGQVFIAQRANVASDAALLSVVDLSQFEVEIKVPESFARELGLGVPAEIQSNGKTYAASVAAVSPEVVAGEVAARLRFKDAQPPGLRQSQRLSARIVMDTRRDVLMVERGPFLEQGGGHTAYVMEGDTAVKRSVRTGTSSIAQVELLDGVREGDRIVVSGSDGFGDAERIRVSGDTRSASDE